MPMTFETLTEKLGFCEQALQAIKDIDRTYDHEALENSWKKLYNAESTEEGLLELRAAFSPDKDGMKMLTCMLHCALYTHTLYTKAGIGDEIYLATMKFLPRFVNESGKKDGHCFFTWDWWFYRQLAMREFRIGELEYEFVEDGEGKKISVHIPADARLERPLLRDSLADARAFFDKHFPAYKDADFYCDSWLLSPALPALLPESSRILGFQREFEILKWEEDSEAFKDWIYGSRDVPTEKLPENTSLQRAVKAHLLKGGKVGWALGRMKRSFFEDKI